MRRLPSATRSFSVESVWGFWDFRVLGRPLSEYIYLASLSIPHYVSERIPPRLCGDLRAAFMSSWSMKLVYVFYLCRMHWTDPFSPADQITRTRELLRRHSHASHKQYHFIATSEQPLRPSSTLTCHQAPATCRLVPWWGRSSSTPMADFD